MRVVRLGPSLALAVAAAAASAALLVPEWRLDPPQLNDNVLHVALARYAAESWARHWPVDHWFPSIASGFPVFAHYPHLSHLVSATLARAFGTDAGRVYLGSYSLLLAALPLSIFVSVRKLGLSAAAAGSAAALYPVLSSKGYYGVGWDSYVWRGHGLTVQLWGTFFLFPSLAWGFRAVRTGRGWYAAGLLLAGCTLAHFMFGYVAALSLATLAVLPDARVPVAQRLIRLSKIACVTAAATAYFALPFLLQRGELLRSRWEPEWKWSSMGWRWVMPRLLRGEFLDGDLFPAISLCALLGLAIAVSRSISRAGRQAERWIATCLLLWIVLFFGRPTLGRLTDLLPLSSGLHMHRFIAAVQVFGLILAGVGLGAAASWVRRHSRLGLAAAGLVVAGLLADPWLQRWAYMRENDEWARAAAQARAAAADFDAVVDDLRALPPGRVHAGFRNTWGKEFKIGDIPVYTYLQSAGFDMVGYLFMAMARPGEWQVRIDYLRFDHLDLYNARYLVVPADRLVPAAATLRSKRGAFALYEVPTSGYFALGSVAPAPSGLATVDLADPNGWEVAYQIGDHWLQGTEPARRHFISMREGEPGASVGEPQGVILDEAVEPDAYGCRVAVPAAVDLILKVTHHPNWRCTINDREASILPVFPGFMSVRIPPGRHEVRFVYRPPWWKKVLFLVALITAAGGLIAALRHRLAGARGIASIASMAALATLSTLAIAGCGGRPDDAPRRIDLLDQPRSLRVVVAPGTGAETSRAVPVAELKWTFESETEPSWKLRAHRGRIGGGPTADVAHGGSRSLCIASAGGPVDADARVDVDARPGTHYVLEGELRTFGLEPTTAEVYGTLYLAEFSYTRAPRDDFNDPTRWHREVPMLRGTTGDWRHFRYELRTGVETRMLRIGLSLGNWGEASGRICVDDVRLAEVPDGPGFGAALGGDGAPLVGQLISGNELRRAVHAYPSAEYRYPLTVPRGARFRFAIGIEDRGASDDSDGVRFEVAVADADGIHPLFARQLDAGRPTMQRGWQDVELPLDAYAGRRVELVFRTAASPPGTAAPSFAGDLGAWAEPVVYVPRDADERRREPNVFFITVDTLRADHLGCYGYTRDTSPAIDALASESVLFENAFTTMPRTTPALASLMTGLYPRAHGLMTLLHTLPEDRVTLAERLAGLGYVSGAVVTHNTSRDSGLQQGFDSFSDHYRIWVNEPRARAEHLVGEAARWVSEHRDLKMFLWLHVWDPHFLYIPPPPYDRWFDPTSRGRPELYNRIRSGKITTGKAHFAPDLSPEEQRQVVALYDGEIRYTDEWIGLFLKKLKELGLYDDALIVFASDHGESLGEHEYYFEHGEYLYDGTLRVPMIVKFPYNRTRGLRVAGKSMIVDLVPTVLGVLGTKADGLAGVDLAFHLDGAREPHPVVYGETDRVFFPENPRRYVEGIPGNWKSIRDGRLKLIDIPHPDHEEYELYDIGSDPGESTNLYRPGDPEGERLAAALRQWLAGFDAAGAAPAQGNQVEIDEKTAERLRKLGYMNEK